MLAGDLLLICGLLGVGGLVATATWLVLRDLPRKPDDES